MFKLIIIVLIIIVIIGRALYIKGIANLILLVFFKLAFLWILSFESFEFRMRSFVCCILNNLKVKLALSLLTHRVKIWEILSFVIIFLAWIL